MQFLKILIFSFFILNLSINCANAQDEMLLKKEPTSQVILNQLQNRLKDIDEKLKDNIWITRYNNYKTYRKIEAELAKIKKDAKKYANWKGEQWQELSYQLTNKIKIKENELELISEYKDSPIGKQIKPALIEKAPEVTNPFIIIEALSYIQLLKENQAEYENIKEELENLLKLLKEKIDNLKQLNELQKSEDIEKELIALNKEAKDFDMVVEIVSTTYEVYSRKIDQIVQETNNSISDEVSRSMRIGSVILFIIVLFFGIKVALKKYIEDDDRHYTTNKLVNFVLIIVIVFVVLFSYIENVSYLVTFLGFASAGIAIALKDWFMSIFGWIAIMVSGTISVGDRIKVVREGVEVVGDVLDISLFKISVREDVTLTSYMTNRRSGRVFFIPNNYIFTDLISNYTFDELRTVWDGIDVYITFDSNHKKAVELVKDILKLHSKGYTDLTRKRLQKMRKRYVLRSANPEPRVFAFIEPYGIVVSGWYHTNSHATLALRSTISMEILDAFKAADDITIAYPTQTLRVSSNNQVEAENLLPGTTSHGLFDPPANA